MFKFTVVEFTYQSYSSFLLQMLSVCMVSSS